MFDALRDAISSAGIDPTEAPLIADGTLRRFWDRNDRRGTENGWLVLHDNGDGSHGAAFGTWKNPGQRHTWSSKKERTTASERAAFIRQMEAARRKAAAEQQQRQAEAAQTAGRLWRQARPPQPDHPYLLKKNIAPYGIRQQGQALVIPVRSSDGTLTGLQFIDPQGQKKFLKGTAVTGCYHAIGGPPADVLLIAEGLATAATLHHATGHPCAVAFSAGNLRPVAEALARKYPRAQILLCADADPVGRAAAAEAAAAVGGSVIEPDFSKGFTHG